MSLLVHIKTYVNDNCFFKRAPVKALQQVIVFIARPARNLGHPLSKPLHPISLLLVLPIILHY